MLYNRQRAVGDVGQVVAPSLTPDALQYNVDVLLHFCRCSSLSHPGCSTIAIALDTPPNAL